MRRATASHSQFTIFSRFANANQWETNRLFYLGFLGFLTETKQTQYLYSKFCYVCYNKDAYSYICGLEGMVEGVKKLLIKKWITENQVFFEGYSS